MAENANSARASVWNTAYDEYLKRNHELAQCQPKDRDVLQRAIAAQQDDLLDTPAPTLNALREKLEILFEGQMTGLDAESEAKRLVIEDLHHLAVEVHELTGLTSTQDLRP